MDQERDTKMLRDKAQALLLISLDDYNVNSHTDWVTRALEAIPEEISDPVGEATRNAINSAAEALNLSDLNIMTLRIPIPISDAIIPIHHVGTQSHHNLGVTNQEVSTTTATGEKVTPENGRQGYTIKSVFRPGTNQTQLQFEMKSDIAKLATLVSIISQISASLSAKTIRVGYFSPTLCIFDSTLVGLNRATVQGGDKEIFTMTLELPSSDVQRQLEQAKREAQPIDGFETKVGQAQGAQMAVSPRLRIPSMLALPQDDRAEIRDGYLFYRIASALELEKIPVTDFDSLETIQRQSYRIFRVVSESVNNQRRNMLGIEYAGQIITLPNDKLSVYKGRLGLVRVLGVFYLGVAP